MSIPADDYRLMARALQLAERGLWTTSPNPRVGCVLVRDAQIVGEGWHEKAARHMPKSMRCGLPVIKPAAPPPT